MTVEIAQKRLSNDFLEDATMNETAMANNPADKLCPIIMAGWASAGAVLIENCVSCRGLRCAWWDAEKERCAVLSLARNK